MKTTLTALALVLAASAASAADLRMSWWGGDGRHVATQEALKVCGAKFGHTLPFDICSSREGFARCLTSCAR